MASRYSQLQLEIEVMIKYEIDRYFGRSENPFIGVNSAQGMS